jgi:polar amino acid transport system substrate-binding protein
MTLVFALALPLSALAYDPAIAPTIAPIAAPFRVVAANLPPLSVENQPAAPGILVELTEAMSTKLGQPAHVEFYPWARALALSQSEPRVAIVALMRTPERETKYQWLVKMYQQQYLFLTKADAPPVRSLNDARKLKRIGVLRGAASVNFVLEQKIPRSALLEDATTEASLKDLDAGFVDAYCCSEAVCAETITHTHRNLDDYHFGVKLAGADVWLAASGGFSPAEVSAMQDAFNALVKNGTLAKLKKKYGLPQ